MVSMNRRSLIRGSSLALAGAGIALGGGTAVRSATFPQQPGDAYGEWSAVTYLPLVSQKLYAENEKAVRSSPYASHLDADLSVPSEAAKAIQSGPLDSSRTLTPSAENLNVLIDPEYKTAEHGYAVLGDQMAYAQSHMFMPGVTTDMFKWWFTWHPIEKERYMLWFPQAHIDNSVEDPSRLANPSLSYEERLYGNPNRIQEWIGPSRLDAIIHFTDPSLLGFDGDKLRKLGFTASASGVCYATPAPDIPFTLMVHLARDTPAGLELFSRYWIGAHPDMARFRNAEKAPGMLRQIGFNAEVAEMTAYEMSVHDLTEFNHLARVLPALYRDFS
ncbi:DAPG hydrolase family protein [Ciceribacter sp. RN22]|uniref:DAPG hydrolase family protein n=1 Tax=Ciceribacter sp. RN22 TaxID=2954932 RepID=UPI002092FCC4|nr:2,4-diacetylphloroglucinol hydrolase [Ciceribacter sp. RN22]MCO6181114.1 2,4-diacetylphloroglucinol hydrolase [Ciceribacter sp. RN22]